MAERLSGAEAMRQARLMALPDETPVLITAGFTTTGARVWYFRFEVTS